jgi:flagellar protein FliO/FliZ
MMDLLWLTISLSGVLGLIIFLFFLMKKVNRMTAVSSGSKLKIIDRANTGRDSSLLVISIGGKLMLIGVSTGRIEKLSDLEISEEDYLKASEDADKQGFNFSDILSNFLNKPGKAQQLTDKEPTPEGEEDAVEPDN